ncbi:MAG: hypothetical protein KBA30_02005 [Clostridia bacterium]|nr:hypothetical protein [Clostridia bacterium]
MSRSEDHPPRGPVSGRSSEPPGGTKRRPAVSRERLAAIERRKARARTFRVVIGVAVLMLVTMLLIATILRKSKPKPQFQFIRTGSIVHSVEASALIIRDEAVLTAPVEGALKPLAAEGVRVSANDRIAMVIRAGMDSTIAELDNCEQQITEIQLELMDKGSAAAAKAIYDETDADIAAVIRLVRRDAISGQLTNTGLYASSLDLLIEQRVNRLREVDFKDARLEQLTSQRDYLSAILGENAGTVTSPVPGIVSYRLDGMEAELTPDAVPALTPERYRECLALEGGYQGVPSNVVAGTPIARVSNGLIQYLAFQLAGAETAWFEPGSVHDVSIVSEGILLEDCTVLSALPSGEGIFVVLSTDRQVARLFDRRVIACSVSVPSLTVEGLKVPVQSVVEKDGKSWIMVNQSGFARRAEVQVLDRDRTYAVVEPVGDNPYGVGEASIVIGNPESVTEGERVG